MQKVLIWLYTITFYRSIYIHNDKIKMIYCDKFIQVVHVMMNMEFKVASITLFIILIANIVIFRIIKELIRLFSIQIFTIVETIKKFQ